MKTLETEFTHQPKRGDDDKLSPEQLDWCRREAERLLEAAAEKVFGPLENRDATEGLKSGGAQEEVKVVPAANTFSAKVASNGAAATTEGGRRHASL